jgi:hypothetical protein
MLKPEVQITKFKEQVSWVEDYIYITEKIDENYWGAIRERWSCFCIKTDYNKYIDAVFCSASDFWDVVEVLNSQRVKEFLVIIEDYLPAQDIEKFLHQNNQVIIPFFMDVRSLYDYSNIVHRVLDGIDLERSLVTRELTMEWE